jgi:hypothetical protein
MSKIKTVEAAMVEQDLRKRENLDDGKIYRRETSTDLPNDGRSDALNILDPDAWATFSKDATSCITKEMAALVASQWRGNMKLFSSAMALGSDLPETVANQQRCLVAASLQYSQAAQVFGDLVCEVSRGFSRLLEDVSKTAHR